ncbi:MAG TPA: hypothetical protein VFL51_18025 [Pseudolabrys sp.]|nr:hypothetical protein [Pseudolabrys sp.]
MWSKAVNVVVGLWAVAILILLTIRPFLGRPARSYAEEAAYIVFFGGIIAAAVAVKIWIAPYMPDRSKKQKRSQRYDMRAATEVLE